MLTASKTNGDKIATPPATATTCYHPGHPVSLGAQVAMAIRRNGFKFKGGFGEQCDPSWQSTMPALVKRPGAQQSEASVTDSANRTEPHSFC